MTDVGRPASLHDGTDANAPLIAHIRLQTSRRAAYAPVSHKLDDGWVARVEGSRAIEMRVSAEGITEPDWMKRLMERQDLGQASSYHVQFNNGDSHSGQFVVEEISDIGDAEDRRRFRLVLLSSGKVVYSSA